MMLHFQLLKYLQIKSGGLKAKAASILGSSGSTSQPFVSPHVYSSERGGGD
jgi:hypothetical protein